jgi:uncharacterized protein YcfL
MKKRLVFIALCLMSATAQNADFATEGKLYKDLASNSVNAVHILSESFQTQNKQFLGQHESVLSIEYLGSQRTATQSLEVFASIRNRSTTPVQLEVRTLFLGKGGMPINDESAWQRLFLDPNGTVTYRELSLKTNQVKHYRVEIREAN